ncbi:hypothetical protein D3C78_1936990 [compost metagenome]
MQSVDDIRQQTLAGQLGLIERPFDHDRAGRIFQCHQAFAMGSRRGQRYLIRAQSFTEQ